MQSQRTCTKCGEAKALDGFYRATNGKPQAECKECTKARMRITNTRQRAARRAAREAEAARLRALSHKVCVKCKEEKPHAEFYKQARRYDGFYPYCKQCHCAAVRARNRLNGPRQVGAIWAAKMDAAKALALEAKTRPCVDCDKTWPPQIMHFHHRDPAAKTANVAKLVRTRPHLDLVRAEIEKCDVLCPNCHALRHLAERQVA